MTRAAILELPSAIAHRGGNEVHPENTPEAFNDALVLGYQRLETDVHVTDQGDILALHGLTIDGKEADEGVDYIHVDGKVISIMGLTKADRKAMHEDGIHIPTLNELFDLSDDAYWNIDAKTPNAVNPLLDLLRARKLFDRVCLGSFSQESTEQMRRGTPPGTQTALTLNELLELYTASFSDDAMVSIPEHTRAQVPTLYMGIAVTTPTFIAAAERHNIPVEAWTINDPNEMTELIDMGIRGIFTDELRVLKSVLTHRGLWQVKQA